MDERLLTILKAVAEGELADNDGDTYCPWGTCQAWNPSERYDSPVHDADCLVTLARQLLSEAGMPMLIYKATWDYFNNSTHEWTPMPRPDYQVACSEEEARAYYPLVFPGTGYEWRRNLHIELVGEALALLAKDGDA